MTEPAPQNGVQPGGEGEAPESQGDGLEGLYDLNAAPEELRPYLEQELKKVEGNVTRRFQEAAEYRKRWEPFEGIEGLTDVDPEELSELLEFRSLASDPSRFEEWWREIGQRLGLEVGEGERGGEGEPAEEGEVPPWAQELREELESLREQVGPLGEHVSQTTQHQQRQEAEQWLNSELEELRSKHPEHWDGLDEERSKALEDSICQLAHVYTDEEGTPRDDAVALGFEDYLRITGQAQGELVDQKLSDQPGPSPSGGRPDTAPEEFSDFSPELKNSVKQRFAAAR